MSFVIRHADAEKDAEAINIIRLQPEVMRTIASLPSEEIEVTRQHLKKGNGKFFVAETLEEPGRVVGYLALVPSECPRHTHVVYLGIMVHRDYQRRGIGKALMKKAVDTADDAKLFAAKRIELDVDVLNEGAIRLYESMGFKKEGTLRKTTITNGTYADDFLMARLAPDVEFEKKMEIYDAKKNVGKIVREEAVCGNYLVRPVAVKDADELCRLYEELGTPKALKEIQQDLEILNHDTHRFVAVEPGTAKICGFAALSVYGVQRMRHRGEIYMQVTREDKSGIISVLIGAIVELADDWLRLIRLEASVISKDTSILSAYKKMGFEIEARKEKSVFHNGSYWDEYVMGRVIQESFLLTSLAPQP